MEKKKLSVAMAAYNGEDYISKQLDSILSQTMPVDEIIIVDDRSTDNTRKVIEKYIEEHHCTMISLLINEENLGYKANFKKALSLCTGEYIFLCDQDDAWDPDKVQKMMKIMETHPEISSLASSFRIMDKEGKPVQVEMMEGRSNNNLLLKPVKENDLIEMTLEEFAFHNYFQGCSMVITRDLRDRFVEHFISTLPHDWVLNMMAAAENGMYFLNTPLFSYRIHGKNTIGLPDNKRPTVSQKFHQIFNLKVRSQFALERYESLTGMKELYPDFYREKKYEPLRLFYKDHLEYLDKGKPAALFMQNFTPYYKDLKPLKARVMDVLFGLLRKLRIV